MVNLWDKSAAAYHQCALTYSQYRETNKVLVDLADIEANHTIVDVACGTGMTTHRILELEPNVKKIYALDASDVMLAKAWETLASDKVEYVHCRAKEIAHHIPEKVDRVLCNSAFWLISPEETLSEIRHVLKPNGLLAFNLPAQHYIMDSRREKNPFIAFILQELRRRGYEPKQKQEGKFTYGGIMCLLTAHDFIVNRVEYFEFLYDKKETQALLTVPAIATFFEDVPAEIRKEVTGLAEREVENKAFPPHKWVYFVAIPCSV